jgi:hypothetical protein
MIKPLHFAGVLLVLCQTLAVAQNDSTFVADAKKNAIGVYTQSMTVQSHVYNGSEYHEYISHNDEHPYLYEEEETGDIKYSGELYEGMPIQYDLSTDQVITSYPHGSKIQLLREKVEYFDVAGHRYVLLDNDKVAVGFYDLLYDGTMKFYVRRTKQRVMKMNGNDAEHVFEEYVKYMILKNDVFHTVKSKRAVLALMSDRKKELKRALKEEKLKYRKDREKVIKRVLQLYEKNQ